MASDHGGVFQMSYSLDTLIQALHGLGFRGFGFGV